MSCSNKKIVKNKKKTTTEDEKRFGEGRRLIVLLKKLNQNQNYLHRFDVRYKVEFIFNTRLYHFQLFVVVDVVFVIRMCAIS